MGVVYRAHDFALDRRVSLKLLRSSGKDSDARRERLVTEAQALARVSHPNVLAVHDVGTWEDEVYLALEHVEGETLRSWLDRAPRTPAEIRGMFLQAARGLQAIHEAGLVHRDVKPENLLVGRDGRLRVADLGLAITSGSTGTEPVRETLQPGTPGYMPLEQHRGEALDARADQFSLAVALFEALVGHRPYGSRGSSRETLEERLVRGPAAEVPRSKDIPPRLRRALVDALAPDRNRRPTSLAPLIDALASPGAPMGQTVGGSVALATSLALLLVAASRSSALPVGTAEASIWMPPAYEFQTEAVEPADLLPTTGATAATLVPASTTSRSDPALASSSPVGGAAPALAPAPGRSTPRPEVLAIGRTVRLTEAPAATPGPASEDAERLAQLRRLLEALYQALTEPHPAGQGPLLALSPTPSMTSPGAPTSAAVAPGAQVNWASAGLAATESSPEFVDSSAATIASIEHRLDQQIRQNRSPPEIAQTRFALAQALWNSSDAEDSQTRALALARQSKAALDSLSDSNSSLLELRQQVDDWISLRTGPVSKPRDSRLTIGRPLRDADIIAPTP
jgi:hypothetical protein